MATEVRLRRGTASQHEEFTGAQAEVTVDTDDFSLRVHDGVTPGGHKIATTGDGPMQVPTNAMLSDPDMGAALVGYRGRSVGARLDDTRSVLDFGATADGVTDDSIAAESMLAELNRLVVPSGRTVVLRNIELQAGAVVDVRGGLKLPNNCADFDRLIYAVNKPDLQITINEVDGNAQNQSGNIGTHLIYLTGCDRATVNIAHAHDHYIASGATTPAVDGIRDASSGAVFLYRCDRAAVKVGLLSGWGREGIHLRECNHSTVSLGHAQGTGLTEWSGLQVGGKYNSVERASVDNAAASAVGFDTMYGRVSNVISTNTRENFGVNFGHPGFPATGSVASNIVVDGAFRSGINIGAGSEDVTVDGFSIRNCGESGINVSDLAQRARIANGVSEHNGIYNLRAYMAQVSLRNTRFDTLDPWVLTVTNAVGVFQPGETLVQGGETAVLRKAIRNRTGSEQYLFLEGGTIGWSAGSVSGSSSGATADIVTGRAPVGKSVAGGGRLVEESELLDLGTAGSLEKLSSGTLIFRRTLSLPAAANTRAEATGSFPASVPFIDPPQVSATIATASDTNLFDVSRLSCTRNASSYTVLLKATVAQTYIIDVLAIGRWK